MRKLIARSLILLLGPAGSVFASFVQTNLISDIPGLAPVTDPNVVDPWGMSFSATSPIWVSDRGAGVSTLFTGAGAVVPLVVTIPPGTPASGPTGQVFAGPTTGFMLNGSSASFIFDTLGGGIDAWNGGTTATQVASSPGAQYEGLALANNMLYAANFGASGGINVYNTSYTQVTVPGGFTDPGIPAGYAPFSIQDIGGLLYVQYAKVTPGVPVPLPGGGGYVDVYNTSGVLQQRLISNGVLDAPWGVALAPAGFGPFGGDLLVGNFGNGEINVFNPTTGAFVSVLTDQNGNPFVNSGLWAIEFGNSSANPNALYFNAGLNQGNDGLFGDIQFVPEPASFGLASLGLLGLLAARLRRSR